MKATYLLAVQRAGENRPDYHEISESRLKSSMTASGVCEGAHERVLAGEHVELWGGGPTVWVHSTETRCDCRPEQLRLVGCDCGYEQQGESQ